MRGGASAPSGLGWSAFWQAMIVFVLLLAGLLWTAWLTQVWPFAGPPEDTKVEPKVAPKTKQMTFAQALEDAVRKGKKGSGWQPEPWKPASADDQIIDDYVRLQKAGDGRAFELLGGEALVAEGPVLEEDFARRATNWLLREKITIIGIWRGEPASDGYSQKPVAGRYTLKLQGIHQSPLVRLHDRSGKAVGSSNTVFTSPEVIVDVRRGKIIGVRTTSAR